MREKKEAVNKYVDNLKRFDTLAAKQKTVQENFKRTQAENVNLKQELKQANKAIESTEKEKYRLSKKVENLEDTVKNLKADKKSLESERVKVSKENFRAEKQLAAMRRRIPSVSKSTSTSPMSSESSSQTGDHLDSFSSFSMARANTSFEPLLNNNQQDQPELTYKTSSTLQVSETSASSVPPKPTKISKDNFQVPFKEFLRNFKEDPLQECTKYSSVATKMMTKQFNVFHLYLKDVRRFNSNLGGFLAAHASLECPEYVKHDKDLSRIVTEYIEELELGEPKHGVIVMIIK